MSNARHIKKHKDRLKEIEEQLEASLNKKIEIVQPTPEGIEFEKQLRSNPNNKIKGRIVPGNLTTFQGIRNIDAASFAVLFPNNTPGEIERLFSGVPDASTTPKMK